MPGMATEEDMSTAFADPHDPASCGKPGCTHGRWAEQMEMMARFDPVTAGLMAALRGGDCKGKTFEHHEYTEAADHIWEGRWRCPACGTTGHYGDFARRLVSLMPALDHLKAQCLDRHAVILVPSDATPGHLVQCFGYEVRRVQGIERPMVAIPGA